MTPTTGNESGARPFQIFDRMRGLREEILADWEARVRAAIGPAGHLGHPILINTLPAFLDNIVEALIPDYPRVTATGGATIASEHGGERARLSGYDPKAVICEYQFLRGSIYNVAVLHARDAGKRIIANPVLPETSVQARNHRRRSEPNAELFISANPIS